MTAPRMDAVRTGMAAANASRIDGHVSPDCLPHIATIGACDHCGAELTGRQIRWCSKACSDWYLANHAWHFARHAALVRDGKACTRCGKSAYGLEVDHIRERRGVPLHQHSCLHHQENLRTLCHGCHVTRRTWEAS